MSRNSGGRRARVLSSEVVFRGRFFDVVKENVIEPAGYTAQREIVRHPGSVVVLAVRDGRKGPEVLLERQYRHAVADYLWELPAGKIDRGEQPLSAAKRELLEETGFSAARWQKAMEFFVSPGFVSERMIIFYASGLKHGLAKPEADEAIATKFVPLSRALGMTEAGTIKDAKTVASLFWLVLRCSPRKQGSSKPA